MAEKLVRWALINYPKVDDTSGREFDSKAFRGEVVDLPDALAEKLQRQGAVVDVGDELDRPGQIMALPNEVGDEELVAWIGQATDTEIRNLAKERPHLAARIAGARETLVERARLHEELLGRAADLVDGIEPDADPDDDGEPGSLEELVKGSVERVADYVADHPEDAQAVLEAENTARPGKPRHGVVQACEVAAQHASA